MPGHQSYDGGHRSSHDGKGKHEPLLTNIRGRKHRRTLRENHNMNRSEANGKTRGGTRSVVWRRVQTQSHSTRKSEENGSTIHRTIIPLSAWGIFWKISIFATAIFPMAKRGSSEEKCCINNWEFSWLTCWELGWKGKKKSNKGASWKWCITVNWNSEDDNMRFGTWLKLVSIPN